MLEARSAYAGIDLASGGDSFVLTERDGLGIATVSARRGQRAALKARVAKYYGIALPDGPQRIEAQHVSALGVAPGNWLLTAEKAGNAFAAALKSALGDAASVADQSDAYAVLRVTGLEVRETLAKLVPIDLHARAFGVGAFAGTVAAHLHILLWRCEDEGEGRPVFEIAVYRSMAADLRAALSPDYSL